MVKIRRRLGITIIVVLLVSIGVVVLVPVAYTSDREVTNLPSVSLPDKGNPKLDSQLDQLVHAERGGGLPAALEDLLQAGCVDILQMPGIRLEDLDKRQIFIHFTQEPTQSQMGIA